MMKGLMIESSVRPLGLATFAFASFGVLQSLDNDSYLRCPIVVLPVTECDWRQSERLPSSHRMLRLRGSSALPESAEDRRGRSILIIIAALDTADLPAEGRARQEVSTAPAHLAILDPLRFIDVE